MKLLRICEQAHNTARELSHSTPEFSGILDLSTSLVAVAMQSPVLLPGALADLFAQASISGSITKADRYGLMAALLDEQLDSDERSVIDRLLWAVRRGRLAIADEVSAVM